MTENRLKFETSGGYVSEAITFEQLLEHLRLAEEACYLLGHLRKENGDELIGQGWHAIAQMLALNIKTVTSLAAKRTHSAIGYKGKN